jgi:hypothetical protein
VKQGLRIALERLKFALKRERLADRAIELGIALEVLLLNDHQPDMGISYMIRHRGTWLRGGSRRERQNTYDLLQDAYAMRSEAAHVGVFSKPLKNRKCKALGSEAAILQAVAELCADLIRIVIQRGGMLENDWREYVLMLGAPPS